MSSKTTTRVERHTAEEIEAGIRESTKARIARFAAAPEEDLRARLRELESEWDLDRALEANGAAAVLGGLLMGRLAHRAWYALAGAAGVLLLQHALSGRCPPMTLIRRLGVRTAREIEHERGALLTALRSRRQAEQGWAEGI